MTLASFWLAAVAPLVGPLGPTKAPGLEPIPGLESLPEFEPIQGVESEAIDGAASTTPGIVADDILSGSMRMTAAYLHMDEDSGIDAEDDGLSTLVVRGIVDTSIRPWISLELNYFAELARLPGFGGGDGTFATASTTQSAYRSPLLTWNGWDQGTVLGSIGVDRFVFRLERGRARLSAGRFPITLTTSMLITPNDFFAPFGATAVNRIYKPGVDALRFEYALRPFLTLDLVSVLGNDDTGDPTWTDSAILGSVNLLAGGFDVRVLGGKVSRRWIAGASVQGNAGPVHIHAEGHVSVHDEDSNGRLDARPWAGKLAAGPSITWPWKNLALGFEYAYLSDGGKDPADYLTAQAAKPPDALPYLGRHYLNSYASVDLIPVLNLSTVAILNAADGSGLSGLTLKYNAADEVDVLVGAFFPWGKAPLVDAGDPLNSAPFTLASEFGGAPLTVYIETRAFF